MAEIISLKAVRKAKAKLQKEQAAAENRAFHGATKAEKLRLKAEKSRSAGFLDGHKKGPEETD